jgi:hypothetical protein
MIQCIKSFYCYIVQCILLNSVIHKARKKRMNIFIKFSCICLLFLRPLSAQPVFIENFFEKYIYPNVELFPSYHMDADLQTFFLHKDDFQKKRFYLEGNTNVEFVLVSYKNLSSVWGFEFQTGMGQLPGNVVFAPMDINYGIVPTLEYKTPFALFQGGLEHHCFHEIDRIDLGTIYWNKLYCAVGSPNYRYFDQWSDLLNESNWSTTNRLSWYLRYGIFVKKFFGIIEPRILNGNNDYVQEGWVNIRYSLLRRKSWILNATSQTKLGTYLHGPKSYYFKQNLGIEGEFRKGKKGIMLFATYTLDDLPLNQGVPRFSKDRLLQVGVRFFD